MYTPPIRRMYKCELCQTVSIEPGRARAKNVFILQNFLHHWPICINAPVMSFGSSDLSPITNVYVSERPLFFYGILPFLYVSWPAINTFGNWQSFFKRDKPTTVLDTVLRKCLGSLCSFFLYILWFHQITLPNSILSYFISIRNLITWKF